MFKLIIVGGKLRGREFELSEGETVAGSSGEASIHIPVQGVSKKHFRITIMENRFWLEDLESSNGTLLNGKVIRKTALSLGDQITIPDTIMQLVSVGENEVSLDTQQNSEEDLDDIEKIPPLPQTLPSKLIHLFKYRVMPLFHGINEEYEWRILLGIILFLFIIINITLTIFPILNDSKILLLNETANRGAHYADQIGRLNARALGQKQLDQVDTRFLKNEEGVQILRIV